MTARGEVVTGRTFDCPACHSRRKCSACGARIRYGKPNENGRWEQLSLSEWDWRRLLLAAAEFDSFAERYEDRPTAAEFCDWLYPDVVAEKVA